MSKNKFRPLKFDEMRDLGIYGFNKVCGYSGARFIKDRPYIRIKQHCVLLNGRCPVNGYQPGYDWHSCPVYLAREQQWRKQYEERDSSNPDGARRI